MTFGSLLERAVERCMQTQHRVGIFLSGGYDSRSVAASIRECYLPVAAFTFGYPESRDVIYAQQLAARLGLERLSAYELGSLSLSSLSVYCLAHRGYGSLRQLYIDSVRYRVLKEKIDIILLGLLGEFSGSHTWPALLLARSRQAAVQAVFDRFVRRRLGAWSAGCSTQSFSVELSRAYSRYSEASFEKIDNDHPMNLADSWNFINLQPRGTFHSPSVDRHLFEARAPHLDVDLVNFLLTIPPLSRLEQRVYKKMIAYKYPTIRDVPCTNSGRPINPAFASEYYCYNAPLSGAEGNGPFPSPVG